MKKLLVALSLVLFVSSLSFAQINKNWDGTKPEVYQGSKCFVFFYAPFVSGNLGSAMAGSYSYPSTYTVNGNTYVDSSNLTVNQMYGIGFQYYISRDIALAIGLNFGNFSTSPTTQGSQQFGGSYKTSGTTFGASVDANYHFKSLYSVSPYFGLNVNFGMGSSTKEFTDGKTEVSGSSIGAGLNLGFDWYFTPGLSLGGKYTLGFVSNGQPDVKFTSGGTTNEYKSASQTTIGTGIASIMLNVHF